MASGPDTSAESPRKSSENQALSCVPLSGLAAVPPSLILTERLSLPNSPQGQIGLILLCLLKELLAVTISSDVVLMAMYSAKDRLAETDIPQELVEETWRGVQEHYRQRRKFPAEFGG